MPMVGSPHVGKAEVVHPDNLRQLIVRPNAHIDSGMRAHDYRAAAAGSLHRLVAGRFVSSDEWALLDKDAQHRLLVHAAAERLPAGDVVSHWSAAALWHLPCIGRWPDRVHVTTAPDGRRASTSALVRHQRSLACTPVSVAGITVTSLAETVIDVARIGTFAQAVAVGDAVLWRASYPRDAGGLPGLAPDQLEQAWLAGRERRGAARARRVLDFVDGRANRPGESLARVTVAELGVAAPELQHLIVLPGGTRYFLDFYFPEFDVGLDFDGRIKYLDPTFRGGRSADQVVYDEKVREDHVRSQLTGYGRADWKVVGSAARLGAALRRIGVRW
jgi:hypothetical protein